MGKGQNEGGFQCLNVKIFPGEATAVPSFR